MLTLITGLPGASKTLNTLVKVEAECQGRDVYYFGIPELKLDWTEVSEEQLLKWFDFPVGSVFVVDEAQRVWPSRANTKEAPESVKRMDKHRHQGIDFYIITQKPTNIDHGVRGFVQRHFHYERLFSRNGAREVEFQLCANDPQDKNLRKTAQSKWVPFNKKFFDKYKSAEIHTYKPKVPRSVYVVALGLLFAGGMTAYMIHSLGGSDDDKPEIVGTSIEQLPPDYFQTSIPDHSDTIEQYIEQNTPRLADLPHTAPIYDKLTQVKTFPRPQCLLKIKTNLCKCFTQQATPLEISYEMCMHIVKSGWFNPYKDESEITPGAFGRGTSPAPGQLDDYANEPPEQMPIYIENDIESSRSERLAQRNPVAYSNTSPL